MPNYSNKQQIRVYPFAKYGFLKQIRVKSFANTVFKANTGEILRKYWFKRAVAFFMDTSIESVFDYPVHRNHWINTRSRHKRVQFPHL